MRAAVLGSSGQLGRALSARLSGAVLLDLPDLDIADAAATSSFSWSGFDLVINTAAYTAVDEAETPEGRVAAWRVNATGVSTAGHRNPFPRTRRSLRSARTERPRQPETSPQRSARRTTSSEPRG